MARSKPSRGAAKNKSDTVATVKAQYEDLPYPERNPADEKNRLLLGSPSGLPEIEHYLYGGRLDRSKPFRVLVAGGGAGDALIMLAQQLADAGVAAELHYIDLSTASRAVAEARAKVRGLDGITFHTGSLLEIEALGLFDYVDCTGVLHHLPAPQEGFRSLARALAPQGGLGLMVYGALGRTGVYDMQAMLRAITGAEDDSGAKVTVARRLLDASPPTNRLLRNPYLTDHKEGGDAGLYDLLLHSTDRAYRVPELAAEIDQAGLRLVSFVEPARYDPGFYIRDKELLTRLSALDPIERAGFAELLAGNMSKHIAYCVRADNADAGPPEGPTAGAVPVLNLSPDFKGVASGLKELPITLDGLTVKNPLPPLGIEILKRCDGRRSLDAIRREIGGLDWFRFKPQFDMLYKPLSGLNKLLLRFP